MRAIREWINIKAVKSPKLIVLLGIIIANLVFMNIASLVIMALAPDYLEPANYWSCLYYTSVMFVSGYVEVVIQDIGETGAALVIFCIFTVLLGFVTFTGAVIGYVTEFISSFIEDADSSSRKLRISKHYVILNWNTRAAEVINEIMQKGTKERVIVLVQHDREGVLEEIEERLSSTVESENEEISEAAAELPFFKRRAYIRQNSIKNKLTVIVREGDSWSGKQLNDISIKHAKSVIILANDKSSEHDNTSSEDILERKEKGDSNTIKTLLQVAHLISEEDSVDNQHVVVEIENDWTMSVLESVIKQKNRDGADNIIPVSADHILGQIFSQFAIMPELNTVYSTLFSNKGVSLFVQAADGNDLNEAEFISEYMKNHYEAIPLALMKDEDDKLHRYYLSDTERQIDSIVPESHPGDFKVSINPDFEIKDKHVIILGHNSKSLAIMEGFKAFSGEWKKTNGPEILDITIIDDEANLALHDNYKQYPFISKVIGVDIYNKDVICNAISDFINSCEGSGSIIVLSDDTVPEEDIDADVLTYLVLIHEIINNRSEADPGFDRSSIDLVVEILNPRNYDILSNYSTNNIVISNRYISKMIMQIGEKEAIFHFYEDLLDYDEEDTEEFDSKELYIKKASEFFLEIPGPCTAAQLIRAVWHDSPDDNKSIILGYFCPEGKMTLFTGDQAKIKIDLTKEHKLVLFSNH